MSGIDHHLQLPPTLNENLSCGVVGEIWTVVDWRCYCNQELIEKFLAEDAMTIDAFKRPKRAWAPEETFAWLAPQTGTTHTGGLYRNGAVYRQINSESRVLDFLLIDEETAKLKGYPDEGWVRLKDWAKEWESDGEHGESPAVPGQHGNP